MFKTNSAFYTFDLRSDNIKYVFRVVENRRVTHLRRHDLRRHDRAAARSLCPALVSESYPVADAVQKIFDTKIKYKISALQNFYVQIYF